MWDMIYWLYTPHAKEDFEVKIVSEDDEEVKDLAEYLKTFINFKMQD